MVVSPLTLKQSENFKGTWDNAFLCYKIQKKANYLIR